MADDEEYEQVQVTSNSADSRPQRRIEVREHDTPKERTDQIIELAQVVLDTLAAQRLEQLKNDASAGDVAAAAAMAANARIDGDKEGGRANSAVAVSPSAGSSHKDVATLLKKKLDETLGGTWHVIVGSSFGGNVTNDAATLVNFVLDGVCYLVLRSGPPDRPAMVDEPQEA